MAELRAQLRFLRMSPRKVRLVADLIRGLDVSAAGEQLMFMRKAASLPLQKLLTSAASNAVHNFGVNKKDLFVKDIQVNAGSTLKRFTPKAFGRASPIRRRSSHILLVLGTRKAIKVSPLKREIPKPSTTESPTLPKEKIEKQEKPEEAKKEARQETKPQKKPGFMRRIFQRKAI